MRRCIPKRAADEIHEEPDAHHHRSEPERRELGHHREADRADAELAVVWKK
jgi:hypothetical protein